VLSGTEAEPYADAVGQFLVDRYGGVAQIKHTLATDPVGVLADVSTIFGGGALALPGKVGKAAAVASRYTNPISLAGKAAGVVAGRPAAAIAGLTTGAGGEAVSTAYRAGAEGCEAGAAFRSEMRGNVPVGDIVDLARGAVKQLRTERGNIYRQEMAKLGGDTTILKFDDIDTAVTGSVKKFKGVSTSPSVETVYEKMRDAVTQWKSLPAAEYHTAEGFDAMKQLIGDIREGTKAGTAERRAADDVYNAIKNTIVKQKPEYAKIMQGYQEASDTIKEIEQTLSLKPNAPIDTSLRKITSALRDNVNTNFGQRKELVAFLARSGATHLLERIAGQSLKAPFARGLAGLIPAGEAAVAAGTAIATGNIPAAVGIAGTMAGSSPRLVGEAAHLAGRASGVPPILGLAARPFSGPPNWPPMPPDK